MAINDKQALFVEEFVKLGNAYRAALNAGYKPSTAVDAAKWINPETLKSSSETERKKYKPAIREAINARMEEKKSELIASQDEVLIYLTSVMRREATESVVVTLSEEETKYVEDEHGTMRKQTIKKEIPKIVEIPARLSDSNKAAEMLGRRYGLNIEEEEKAAKLAKLKAETARIKGDDSEGDSEDDGFIDALRNEAKSVWEE